MTGAGAVLALILLEWAAGWVAVAAWSQTWGIISRGHFRITAYAVAIVGVLATLAYRSIDYSGSSSSTIHAQNALVWSFLGAVILHVLVQYSNTDAPGAVVGFVSAAVGTAALATSATLIHGWNAAIASVGLLTGAALLGAVTNGMMLGHWYLNQPGLKTWALARLTTLGLAATTASVVGGAIGARTLIDAKTKGAALGISSFGGSFGPAFFGVWAGLIAFTWGVVWAARRCVQIRSIQSATGLYYVAILTAGVAEFLVRYLMLNAS
ncbi:MAG: hypothetical protein ABR579_00240 [Actinomycetota bacterium]